MNHISGPFDFVFFSENYFLAITLSNATGETVLQISLGDRRRFVGTCHAWVELQVSWFWIQGCIWQVRLKYWCQSRSLRWRAGSWSFHAQTHCISSVRMQMRLALRRESHARLAEPDRRMCARVSCTEWGLVSQSGSRIDTCAVKTSTPADSSSIGREAEWLGQFIANNALFCVVTEQIQLSYYLIFNLYYNTAGINAEFQRDRAEDNFLHKSPPWFNNGLTNHPHPSQLDRDSGAKANTRMCNYGHRWTRKYRVRTRDECLKQWNRLFASWALFSYLIQILQYF